MSAPPFALPFPVTIDQRNHIAVHADDRRLSDFAQGDVV